MPLVSRLTTRIAAFAALASLALSSLLAQELPSLEEDSFEVEPPLLIPPGEVEKAPNEPGNAQTNAAQLTQDLTQARKSAASAERLARIGVLAKAEAEQRALRAVRLEAELARAKLVVAEEQLALQKARPATDPPSKEELETATAALAEATTAAQNAEENYRKAQLEAAALNLRRQKKLLALGSAHKSDVTRAEEKLEKLKRGDETPR